MAQMNLSPFCLFVCFFSFNLPIEQKQTFRHGEQTSGFQGGGGGSGMDWELGVSRCKLLHLK